MNTEANHVFANELSPDEALLWSGKPNPAILFTKIDVFLVPFSIVWCAFAVFWTISAAGAGGGLGGFGLFGIPFVLAGLYFTVGRFLMKIAKKKQTIYAITDRRVLVAVVNSKGERKSFSSAALKNIQSESITMSAGNTGSILFGPIPFGIGYYLNTGMDFYLGNRMDNIIAFFDIDNADQVFQIYKQAKYS